MSQRENNLLWMRDLLEHLRSCRNQLEWTSDQEVAAVLTEAMLRDLEHCQRLCEGLRKRTLLPLAS